MTKIEWTHALGYKGESWNLWHGCTKISKGCQNCYGEQFAKRLGSCEKYDGTITYFLDRLEDPLHWKKPRMVFVNSMSDLFHKYIDYWTIEKVFDVMIKAKNHIFQILTKRPEIMVDFLECWEYIAYKNSSIPKNIWLGVSVESPEYINRIDWLLKIPAAVRFVSFEPLLENMGNLKGYLWELYDYMDYKAGHPERDMRTLLSWLIIGCESGPRRRPCKLEWVRNIVKQCKNANVPVFIKQLDINGKVEHDINKFPEDLRIRNFPKIEA